MEINAQLDFETSGRAGAGGMFQVISLTDEDGDDIKAPNGKLLADLVDQGTHFSEIKDLETHCSKIMSRSVTINAD